METISRLSSMLETARELTLEAAQGATNARSYKSGASLGSGGSSQQISVPQIKKLLDSRNDRDILDGLRRIIPLMYRSDLCLPFFSAVVKNVASPNIEIKKLVYIYLVHHAEAEPDLALLSINAIQKSLTDRNPQVRSLALRTMAGIRVPVISQIVSLAIKRGCTDLSPLVRKAAALAVPRCYRLDPSSLSQMEECLAILLNDQQYFVVGPAVAAFLDICPDRIDLLHKHYRSIVRKLVDMDEWSQIATMRLMTIYSRKCFPRKTKQKKVTKPKDFHDDHTASGDEESSVESFEALDPDLGMLLNACQSLLQSRNSSVILNAVRCLILLGTSNHLQYTVGPLISLLRGPQDIQQIVLYNIICVVMIHPKAFIKYTTHFLINSRDTPDIWKLKLEILTTLFPHCGGYLKGLVLGELEHFSGSSDSGLVRESARAIGRCAQGDSAMSSRCLAVLLRQISSTDENLASEVLTVIRHLIQQDPESHKRTVVTLAKHLDSTPSADAKASIIWLVGEFARYDADMAIAPDVLRILAKGFADEEEITKQQIVLLGAKVYLLHLIREGPPLPSPSPPAPDYGNAEDEFTNNSQSQHAPPPPEADSITLLWRYILLMARYDTSYDLRDRARLYKSLLANPHATDLANLLLLGEKPVPYTEKSSATRKNLLLGSSTLVIGPEAGIHGLRGYESLPEWVQHGSEPDRKLRDEIDPRTGKTTRSFGMGGSLEPAGMAATAGGRLDRALWEHQTSAGGRVAGAAGIGAAGIGAAAANRKKLTLDDWLAESESESEEEEDDDESDDDEDEDNASESESSSSGETDSSDTREQSDSDGEDHAGRALLVK